MSTLTTFAPSTLKPAAARFAFTFLFALAALLASASAARAQFNTPTVNGSVAPGEYGDHVENQNQKTSGGQVWYVTWDATNLYVGVTNANLAEGAVVYLDTDPLNPPRSGTDANGSTAGFNYDNANFTTLPFRADFVAYFKNGYREFRRSNGAGGWTSQTAFFGSYADSGAGNVRELAIPWNDITNGAGRPASFNFFGYLVSAGGFVYGQVPPSNPGGLVGTNATAERFYRVPDTGDGAGAEPFASEYGNCVAPPANLAAWWTGNAYRDDIQNNNHLTMVNGAAFASGKVRSAFSLDGADDYAEADDSPSLSMTGSVSIDAWIRPDSLSTGNHTIVSKYQEGTNQKSYWFYVDGGGVLWFFVGGPNGDRLVRSQSPVVNVGVFTHVAATFDGSTSVAALYVNGASVPLTVFGGAAGGVNDTNTPLRIGASSDSSVTALNPVAHFHGLIDEVEIFDRALGASEVNAVFSADNAGKCAADLTITDPSPQPTSIMIGEQTTYSILVTNLGNADATGVVLTSTLPAGLTYVSDTGGPSGCTFSAPQLTCPVGTLAPGDTFFVQLTASGTAGGVYSNFANAESPSPDLRPGTDKLFYPTTVVTLKSLTLSHAGRTGGCSGASQNATGTILFNKPAPRGGTISLDSNSAAATVPPSVSFNAGDTQVQFAVAPQAVASNTTVIINATLDNGFATVSAPFVVKPILIQSFTLGQNTVTGGNPVSGTVTLTCAPAQNTTVTLTTNRPTVTTLPATFQVSAGQPSGTFNIQTSPVSATTTATITATLNGKTFTQKLTITPAQF